jgi:hypothetical protein
MIIIFMAVLLPLGVPGAGWPVTALATGTPAAGGPTTAAPHFSQNLVPSVSGDPQLAQNVAMFFLPGMSAYKQRFLDLLTTQK